MRILSLYIDNFGKLSSYSLDLGQDLNCICRENGYGKTTLAVFIKSMLYGMQKSTKRSPSENDRKHYFPWNNGAFGGTLDIETEKGRYRIERSFGKKESDDTFVLRELSTGLESRDYTENIGVELFGIDAPSFEKSVFTPQGRDVDFGMTSDIGAKLSNMLESSADMAQSDRAIEFLEKYMKRFKLKKGSGGIIDDLNDELAETLSECESCRRAADEALAQKQYLETLNERLNTLKEKEKQLGERLESERSATLRDVEYSRYLEYIDEAEKCRKKAEELRALFPEKLPDKEELEGLRTFCRGIELKEKSPDFELSTSDTVKYNNFRDRFGDTPPTDEELDSVAQRLADLKSAESEIYSFRISDPPEKEPPVSRAGKKALLAAFAVFLAGAAGLGVMCLLSFSLGFAIGAAVCGAIGLAFVIAFAIKSSNIRKTELANEEKYRTSLAEYDGLYASQEDKRLENERERAEIEALLGRYYPTCPGGADTNLARLYTEVETYRALIDSTRQIEEKNLEKRKYIEGLRARAKEMFRTYGFDVAFEDYDEAIRNIFEKMQELARSVSDYTEIRRRAVQYAKEKGIDPNSPPVSNDTRHTEEELATLRTEIQTLSGEIGGVEHKISVFEESAEKQHALLHRADSIRQEIELSQGKYACAQKARDLLEKARDGLSSKYLGSMESTFTRNCDVFGTLLPSPRIDAKLGVTFRDGGANRESEWYSAGVRCIINLCMRLSLTDALFENEKPFMVLDDPFTDLDEKHLGAAKQIVKELSAERQIIYFTCSEERVIG